MCIVTKRLKNNHGRNIYMRRLLIGFVLFFVGLGMVMPASADSGETGKASAPGAVEHPLKTKKLIEWGWDMPVPGYIRQNIREMEKQPLDGVIFWLRTGCNDPKSDGGGNVFSGKKWDDAMFTQIFEDCKNIQWQKFTDNFVVTYAAAAPGWDWFSDADWDAAHHNLGIVVKAAVLARCRGICFDPEPYGNNPWNYSAQIKAKEKTFAEYEAKVRQRGAEFVRTISAQMPKCVIHTMFQLSYLQGVMDETDPGRRSEKLSQHMYSLLPAFLNGMLDAAGPGIVINDGNEDSYYYENSQDFQRSYHMMRQRALSLVAPENVRKYQTHVQACQALFADYAFGMFPSPGTAMTPEERAKWFEHNVYYALSTSDEFVWLYSERMNWWKNTGLPSGITESVESAVKKLDSRKGFDSEDLESAFKRVRGTLKRRTAAVVRFSLPPVIDGKLDDTVWKTATPLDEFVPLLTNKNAKIEAATKAWLGYDDQNLYVAFQCAEPSPDKMKIVGDKRDGNIWGDVVEIFLTQGRGTAPFVHLALNPRNVQWDTLNPEHVVKCYPNIRTDFDPKWQSAVQLGEKEWTVEVAIPWSEMGISAPRSGSKLGANLCRTRACGGVNTTWSQNISWFMEDENFGTLEFK